MSSVLLPLLLPGKVSAVSLLILVKKKHKKQLHLITKARSHCADVEAKTNIFLDRFCFYFRLRLVLTTDI